MNIEYYIKQVSKDRHIIAKFDGSKAPTAVYEVDYSMSTDTGRCTCFGFIRHHVRCKHIDMIKDWIEKGRPMPIQLYAWRQLPLARKRKRLRYRAKPKSRKQRSRR